MSCQGCPGSEPASSRASAAGRSEVSQIWRLYNWRLYSGVGRNYSWYTAGVTLGAMASRRSRPMFGLNKRLQADER